MNVDSNDGYNLQKNKRLLSSSSSTHDSPNSSILTKNKNKKLFKSTNWFEHLSPDETLEESSMNDVFVHNNSRNDTPKPPSPIFVRDVIDFTEVCTKRIDLIGVDNFF